MPRIIERSATAAFHLSFLQGLQICLTIMRCVRSYKLLSLRHIIVEGTLSDAVSVGLSVCLSPAQMLDLQSIEGAAVEVTLLVAGGLEGSL